MENVLLMHEKSVEKDKRAKPMGAREMACMRDTHRKENTSLRSNTNIVPITDLNMVYLQ